MGERLNVRAAMSRAAALTALRHQPVGLPASPALCAALLASFGLPACSELSAARAAIWVARIPGDNEDRHRRNNENIIFPPIFLCF